MMDEPKRADCPVCGAPTISVLIQYKTPGSKTTADDTMYSYNPPPESEVVVGLKNEIRELKDKINRMEETHAILVKSVSDALYKDPVGRDEFSEYPYNR